MTSKYTVKFDYLDSCEYRTLWITYTYPDRGYNFTPCITYPNRATIAALLGFTTTKLTKILVNKYNAIHYGGRKWNSTFLFKDKDIPEVRDYIESLLIAKQLQES